VPDGQAPPWRWSKNDSLDGFWAKLRISSLFRRFLSLAKLFCDIAFSFCDIAKPFCYTANPKN
jgi:hypothetical protein